MGDAVVKMKIEPTFENVSAVRLAVQDVCRKQYGWPGAEPLIDELLMAATEAMNNAVEHSGAKEVEIELIAGARRLVVRVLTAGKRFDPPSEVAFPDLDGPGGLPEGGFGLAIIREMADAVHYDYCDGKNIVTLEKNISENEGGQDGN
ncbi:MAG: ATP-binding protein [Nitrospirae bacterium]|nr:MAG: ATP-binding protein [Nitrospirota bacterium]